MRIQLKLTASKVEERNGGHINFIQDFKHSTKYLRVERIFTVMYPIKI